MRRIGLCSIAIVMLALHGRLDSQEAAPPASTSPFYPLDVGNEWHYRSGEDRVVIRVLGHEVIELMDEKEKPNKLTAALIELNTGKRKVFEKYTVTPDGIYRLNTAGHQVRPPLRFFKLPPKEGDTWTVQSDSEGVPLKGVFTTLREPVTVPAGKFDSYVSATKDFQVGGESTSISYWFVENIGMVKQTVNVGEFKRVLELEKFVSKKVMPK